MKAITRTQYGSPDILKIKEFDKPVPKDNEILVRVRAATVNRTDCGILLGKPFLMRFFTGLPKPRSPIPGTDFAGKIEKLGKKVKHFKVGDRVWGFNDTGLSSHAEYMCISVDEALTIIPGHVSYDEAVSCAEGAHYAFNFINKVDIKAGDKVLVNGATGAIGSAAVQILKHYGVIVTAVGDTENMELLKSLGADKIVDYTKEDFTKDDQNYHFIFDAVGKSSFLQCKHLLLPNGVYISSELGPNAQNLYLPLITKLKGGKKVIFPIPKDCKRSVIFINKLIENKEFKAVIDRKYPMKDIQDAYQYVLTGKKTGNVIINFG